ncbi:unnamed protein product [Cyprideis torosa]|uniref:Uncharacterized protein n=1 Tax=Cyprideis torosa TaxID=163714 RepID=A0A7R8WEE8_9CRUS|nr:unnamed protein product [Cyprideis torosa]CAG0895718.1 unnamed protein product [Cyprideis torosa]
MPSEVLKTSLPPHIQEIALKELNEVPERRGDDIQAIREWLKKEPHLQTVPTDDATILRFLRGCKFSLQRTKEKLDAFYTMKTVLPEFFNNRDPKQKGIQQLLQLGIKPVSLDPLIPNVFRTYLPIPNGYDKLGRRVVIIRTGIWTPSLHKIEDVFKLSNMIMDLLLQEDEQTQVTGITGILDMAGSTMGHFAQYTPPIVKKAMTCWQDGYPTRPKGMHYVNLPPSFEMVFGLFKAFMKPKMLRRLHIHTHVEELHEDIPKEVLPLEYGGTNGKMEDYAKHWRKKVEASRAWFLSDEAAKSQEDKRRGKPKTTVEMFGLEGSFRKLNLD